jgi:hypothetical protein
LFDLELLESWVVLIPTLRPMLRPPPVFPCAHADDPKGMAINMIAPAVLIPRFNLPASLDRQRRFIAKTAL